MRRRAPFVLRFTGYDPAKTKQRQGTTVEWKNRDSITHTATQDDPLGIWDSGGIRSGDVASVDVAWAGTFPYHCDLHPQMEGVIKVPIKLSPSSGDTSDTFTIRLATEPPPTDFVYEVQVKEGNIDWAGFAAGVAEASVEFDPDTPGTYSFRSRPRNLITDGTSRYSPAKSIVVS